MDVHSVNSVKKKNMLQVLPNVGMKMNIFDTFCKELW